MKKHLALALISVLLVACDPLAAFRGPKPETCAGNEPPKPLVIPPALKIAPGQKLPLNVLAFFEDGNGIGGRKGLQDGQVEKFPNGIGIRKIGPSLYEIEASPDARPTSQFGGFPGASQPPAELLTMTALDKCIDPKSPARISVPLEITALPQPPFSEQISPQRFSQRTASVAGAPPSTPFNPTDGSDPVVLDARTHTVVGATADDSI